MFALWQSVHLESSPVVASDLVDSAMGALMLSVAVGMIAVVLIALSRRFEATVRLEDALMAPAAAISLGAAVVNLWLSPQLAATSAASGLLLFLLGAFQVESAFAFTRPGLRRGAVRAGLLVNAVAILVSVASHAAGALGLRTAPAGFAGTDVAATAFEIALVMTLGLALRSRRRTGREARISAVRMVEIRSVAVACVTLLTFLALAGESHVHG